VDFTEFLPIQELFVRRTVQLREFDNSH